MDMMLLELLFLCYEFLFEWWEPFRLLINFYTVVWESCSLDAIYLVSNEVFNF